MPSHCQTQPVPAVVCVARKPHRCPSHSRRRDHNKCVHWRSLYKGAWVLKKSAKPLPKSAAQSIPVESRSTSRSSRSSGAGPRNFTPGRSRSRSQYIGSPLNASYVDLLRFAVQFLCLKMCVYGGSEVPQGGVGDRHLATVPQGVAGTVFPGVGQDGGEYPPLISTEGGGGSLLLFQF